uniref:GPS domain-containing protein n=1 Tax=Ciona intestinalis TaxID=7719 RepID=F6TPY1_CIOIN
MVVLSATVEQTSVNNLQEPVIIQLVTNTALNKTLSETSLCVFWNMTENLWSTSGSTVYETDQIKTICHFNHLTNFATLLARGDSAEIVSSKALDIVSIVGSSISSFCLFATILCFLCVPKLRSGGKLRGAVLLINLSLALLLLNLLLIFSEQKFVYLSSNSCLAVGVLLHFALLASFGW